MLRTRSKHVRSARPDTSSSQISLICGAILRMFCGLKYAAMARRTGVWLGGSVSPSARRSDGRVSSLSGSKPPWG